MEEKKVPDTTSGILDIAEGDLESQGFSAESTKQLLRKLDLHIIPFMSLIYLYGISPSMLLYPTSVCALA